MAVRGANKWFKLHPTISTQHWATYKRRYYEDEGEGGKKGKHGDRNAGRRRKNKTWRHRKTTLTFSRLKQQKRQFSSNDQSDTPSG